MLWMPDTLGALRDSIAGMIEEVGEDAPIGEILNDKDFAWGLCAQLVYVNLNTGEIAGTEGEDYRWNPKTEIKVVAF